MISRIRVKLPTAPRRRDSSVPASRSFGLKRPLLFGAQRSAHESEPARRWESRCVAHSDGVANHAGRHVSVFLGKTGALFRRALPPAPLGDLGPMPVRSVNA